MESQYPIKRYKAPPKDPTWTTVTMTAKMGKTIEVVYSDANPEFVTFTIKSNRGKIKDVLEIPIDDALLLAKTLGIMHDSFREE